MNFQDAANFVTNHTYTLLGIGWGAAVVAGLVRYEVLPRIQPKRPVNHSAEYVASKAKADVSMARIGLSAPKEP